MLTIGHTDSVSGDRCFPDSQSVLTEVMPKATTGASAGIWAFFADVRADDAVLADLNSSSVSLVC